MTEKQTLYTCSKPGCNFKAKHKLKESVEYLTDYEYKLISKDGKLVCPENPSNTTCGMRELEPHEYPKPKKEPLNIKLIAAIVAGLLVIGAVVFFIMRPSSAVEEPVELTEEVQIQLKVDPEPVVEVSPEPTQEPESVKVVKPAPVKTQPAPSSGSAPKGTQTLTIDGNTYKGEVLNGKPHGLGTFYYAKSSQISPKDLKKRMAEAGDYITGEFFEGGLVQGKLFDKNNELKEIILIGR